MKNGLASIFIGLAFTGLASALALATGCEPATRDFGSTSSSGSGVGGAGGAGGASVGVTDVASSASTGAMGCTDSSQCMTANPCATPYCDTSAGLCAEQAIADGPQPGTTDLPNDCVDYMCLGGVATTVNDDTESPDASDPCSTPSCSNGMATYTALPVGSVCPGGVCDNLNQCVPCYKDGVMDGNETDVDCGGVGAGCVTCPLGKQCSSGNDCTSGNCCTECSGTCIIMNAFCQPC